MASPVLALVGSDSFLQSEALRAALAGQPTGTARTDFEGETAQLADVLDELRSFSMFSAGKSVVVRSADDFVSKYRAEMEDYVAAPSSSATLILRFASLPSNQRIYKLIQKHGAIEKCEPPGDRDLAKWVTDRAASQHNLKIAFEASRRMAELVGADLGRIDNELAKLALQVDGGKVSEDDVNAAVVFQREQEMWKLTDELTAGRPDRALERWRQLLQSDSSSEFRAVTWLTIWLEKAAKARALGRQRMNPAAIAKELKIWPANHVDALLHVANHLGEAGLAKAVHLLTDLDARSKSGRGAASENVERFILSLSKR